MAISVAVAVDDAADLLVKKVEERSVAFKVSNGTELGAEMRPVISPESREIICKTVAAAAAAGAAMVVDGRNIIVPGHEKGFWVGTTVIDDVKTGMFAYTEEIFGPVLVVVRVDDLDAGIALINATRHEHVPGPAQEAAPGPASINTPA